MATLLNNLWQGLWYKGGLGNWSYQFHRLAGLATLLFLALHILDTATVFFFPSLYIHAIELYRSAPFMIGEIALVAGLFYHGMNGLKIIFFDVQPQRWNHANEQKANLIVYIGTFLLWVPAAIIMGNNLWQCSILNACGG